MFDINQLPELNSECFTYENYESGWWIVLDLDYLDALELTNVMRCVRKYAVGYCDSNRVRPRPKTDSYAVMFEKDGERFWFHIQKWEFEAEEF